MKYETTSGMCREASISQRECKLNFSARTSLEEALRESIAMSSECQGALPVHCTVTPWNEAISTQGLVDASAIPTSAALIGTNKTQNTHSFFNAQSMFLPNLASFFSGIV